MSDSGTADDAWLLTRAISPRDRVRVASVDATGAVLNQYARSQPINGRRPDAPWAVYLAASDGFHLLTFDLDSKQGADVAAHDADTISALLARHGIDHLLCQSGPSAGRHIWVALTAPAAPDLVATLARLLASTCASLDIAPLTNPVTGCVRPPLSPHRNGSHSAPLAGHLDVLRAPTTHPAQLRELAEDLAASINTCGTPPAGDGSTSIRTDTAGHPHLPGTKRPLPPASAAALQQHPGTGDASTVLWKVLVGAAASHWHLADVAAIAPTAPGLEHLRSRRITPTQRTPRQPRDRSNTLTRQWGYAVAFVAGHPRGSGIDASFDSRAATVTNQVRQLQGRADASPGRWNRGGGAADRRVLDALHLFALAAVSSTVEADVRRIALTCGIGRETARVALHRLAADGWISRAREAAGVHGATWAIDPHGAFHSDADTARSQAATRPEGAGAAERTLLVDELTTRLQLLGHDVFSTAHALPHAAGNSYAHLSPTRARSAVDVTDAELLERLRRHGLARLTDTGWIRADAAARDVAATRLGVGGRLAARRRRYTAEREVWSWWQAEHEWMCSRRSDRSGQRRAQQNPLWQVAGDTRYPKHPRRSDGKADYSAARAAHARGALGTITLAA